LLVADREKYSLEQMQEHIRDLVVIRELIGDDSLFLSAGDMLILLCKLQTNLFHICNDLSTPIGLGYYPPASLLNHSCLPNCVMVFEKEKLLVRNIRNIAPGEELTIPYVDTMMPRSERRRELQERYFFLCECERCLSAPHNEDELLARLRCKNQCGVTLVTTTDGRIQCPRCDSVFPQSRADVETKLQEASDTFHRGRATFHEGGLQPVPPLLSHKTLLKNFLLIS